MNLDSAASDRLKRAGMQLALDYSGDWQDLVLIELRAWLATERARGMRDMTVERFRADATTQPRSPACWGSLPRLACKAGLIRPLLGADGEQVFRKAASAKTHSHRVGVYAICVAEPAINLLRLPLTELPDVAETSWPVWDSVVQQNDFERRVVAA